MESYEVKTPLVQSHDTLGESPLWDHRRNALFWVDIDNGLIHSLEPATDKYSTWSVGEKLGCIAMHAHSGFILATESGLSYWNPESNQRNQFLPVKHSHSENLFNDGKVDPLGRFWIGTKGPSGTSNLWILQDNQLQVKLSGLSISNGLDWSADGRYFYHTDSGDNTIYRYEIDFKSAELSNRIEFFKPEIGTPDGLTIDGDGNIWTAIWDGWQVLQLSSAGEILTEVKMPVQRPTSVSFGGQGLRTLFITTASEGLSPQERREQPYAGDLFVIQPGVKGIIANITET
ncbi:MAG: SMP-30/gluconolactonase/LRE family protein [Anaerolineaceae bacterium]|nr:SMP-30/gluconolactonase/LRE family protein [Anaerolineaceae bacterium]MDD4042027.1 SMP-30/gluconolactonase/LRE family protein [Anaerolineaceae bacterium]